MTDRPNDDEANLRRALDGDAQAMAVLARAWLRPVYLVAFAHLRRASDAEDLAQDVVAHALAHLDRCRDPARVRAWVLASARNRAKNLLRWERLRHAFRRPTDAATSVGAEDPSVTLRADLLRALAGLTTLQREVILLCDLEGWTHGEVAAQLGLSEVASRQHLFVARRKLRAALTEGVT